MRRALPLSALAVVKSSSLTASVSSIVVPPSELPLTQYIIPGSIYCSIAPREFGFPCGQLAFRYRPPSRPRGGYPVPHGRDAIGVAALFVGGLAFLCRGPPA